VSPAAFLIQPDAGGRISGGYLYNSRMAAGGAWRLLNANTDTDRTTALLAHAIEAVPNQALLLVDSIWLTEPTLGPFLDRRRAGGRVGLILHSLPSMITAAESGAALVTEPTAWEVSAIEQLDLVVTPGDHYAKMLAGRAVKGLIAPPGVDDAWRCPPRPRRGRCSLVSVGAVTPRKGFLDVVRVLANRGTDDFEWTILGSLTVDSDYAERVQDAAQHLDGIRFLGQQPPEVTRQKVLDADVLVMPSYDENHPLVLLEALAASVPTVAYAAGATRRMIDHGTEGLVGEIGDTRQLGEHLSLLIDDEPKRQRMAAACWRKQPQLPSWAEAARFARQALETTELG
jgi:glycosyltransferase involved in cell wall biosynthesis